LKPHETFLSTKDTSLLITSIFSYYTDSIGWWPSTQISYTYNERGDRLETLWQFWEKGKLKQFKKIGNSYNDENQLRTEFYQNWQNDRWENQARYEYFYNQNYFVTKKEKHTWTYDSNTGLYYWINSNSTDYNYNSSNLLTESIYSERPDKDLKKISRNTYIYDTQNNPIEEKYQAWGDTSWIDNTKYIRKFAAPTKMSWEAMSIYLEPDWMEISRDSIVYNSDFNPIELYHQELKNSILTLTKEIRTFDTARQFVLSLSYQRDDTGWVNLKKVSNKYDEQGYLIETINQQWKDTAWFNQSKEAFEYWHILTGIESIANEVNDLIITPNPATDFLEISYSPSIKMGSGGVSVEVYNVFGQKVTTSGYYSATLPYQGVVKTMIDVSSLSPGVYLVKVEEKSGKFVKIDN